MCIQDLRETACVDIWWHFFYCWFIVIFFFIFSEIHSHASKAAAVHETRGVEWMTFEWPSEASEWPSEAFEWPSEAFEWASDHLSGTVIARVTKLIISLTSDRVSDQVNHLSDHLSDQVINGQINYLLSRVSTYYYEWVMNHLSERVIIRVIFLNDGLRDTITDQFSVIRIHPRPRCPQMSGATTTRNVVCFKRNTTTVMVLMTMMMLFLGDADDSDDVVVHLIAFQYRLNTNCSAGRVWRKKTDLIYF